MSFDVWSHMRHRRWVTAIVNMVAVVALYLAVWLVGMGPVAPATVTIVVGLSSWMAYRRGAEDMHELWMLREAAQNAPPMEGETS